MSESLFPKEIVIGVPGANKWHPVDPGHGLMLQFLQQKCEKVILTHQEGVYHVARNRIVDFFLSRPDASAELWREFLQ